MGYDAFGLPAEQYAIQTGQHPAVTTEQNIARYREQLDKIGFSFDWDREVRTCDPAYYKWTQWALHGRRVERVGREAPRAGVAELPPGVPRRYDGELVSETRDGAGQRRGA